MVAHEAKDYRRAMGLWLPLAEAGHAEAQYRVGRLYEEGEGIAKDEAVAATWYRKAAEQGHALGQALLGNWLWHHWRSDEEYAEAGRMFRLSAKQGEAWGLYGAGLWLAYPTDGGTPMAATAVYWFERAAAQGLAEAQYEMGERYAWGDGVRENSRKAIEWYRKAADQGMVEAFDAIGFVYSMSTDDRFPRDPREALRWRSKAADLGHFPSQFSMAQAFLEGKLVPRDLVEGLKWAIIANRSGRTSENVLKALGQIRMTGEDRAEARRRAEAWKPKGSWRKPLVSRPSGRSR
jgi:TPR repeat protein